jgi:hypothetical protein
MHVILGPIKPILQPLHVLRVETSKFHLQDPLPVEPVSMDNTLQAKEVNVHLALLALGVMVAQLALHVLLETTTMPPCNHLVMTAPEVFTPMLQI